MDTIISFLTTHWMLSSLFLLIALALIINELSAKSLGVQEIHPIDAVDFMNHQDALVIDIRGASSFQSGHILGALSIPFTELTQKLKQINKYQDKPIIITCNMGQEAKKAYDILKQHHFKQIFVLQGGLNAWRAASLPLTKKS